MYSGQEQHILFNQHPIHHCIMYAVSANAQEGVQLRSWWIMETLYMCLVH